MNETIHERKNWTRYMVMAIILIAVAAVVFLAMPSSSYCSGGCAVKACRPGDTCYFKGKKYVEGLICNPADTGICDAGILIDCYCHTYIKRGKSGAVDTLTCECTL